MILFLGLLILIIILCINIEPFVGYSGDLEDSNMIPVIEFDNNDRFYESKCLDDYKWRKDAKTCRDYSIFGSDCSDVGEDGRTATEACKVACDNCSTYKNIEFIEKKETKDSRHILYEINILEQKLKEIEGEQ
tara:strand:+ start:518 stop:916 length:399 start_codon:yes stop_codon:yes gene_type:complete